MNLFCRWQTLIGATLLVVFGKLGWVEISRISRSYIYILIKHDTLIKTSLKKRSFFQHVETMSFRSAALSWLPGSLLFVGNIYAGSRALSHIVRHPPAAATITAPTPLVINPIRSLAGHPAVLHSAELLPRREQPHLEGLPL